MQTEQSIHDFVAEYNATQNPLPYDLTYEEIMQAERTAQLPPPTQEYKACTKCGERWEVQFIGRSGWCWDCRATKV